MNDDEQEALALSRAVALTHLTRHIQTDDETGCWLWTGSKNNKGYAQLGDNGRTRSAHRVSYELFKGEIPAGLQLDHLCMVRHCVNPEHLEAVTQSVNMRRSHLPASLRHLVV